MSRPPASIRLVRGIFAISSSISNARGITVLLSSHLLSQVQEVCDRVGILANGVLVREGALEELLRWKTKPNSCWRMFPASFLQQITALVEQSGARLVEHRKSQTTLERLFLEATRRSSQKRRTSNVER